MLTDQDIAEAKRALKELADEAQGNGNSEGWIAAQERPILAVIAAHAAKAAPAVPKGWKVERKSDLRIRVESPSGDAWSFENVDDRGSSNLFVYQMLDAMLAAPSQPLTPRWLRG